MQTALNTHNDTLLSSLNFEDFLTSQEFNKKSESKIKSQKFSTLSLKKNKQEENVVKSSSMEDTFDDIEETQILIDNADTSFKTPARPTSPDIFQKPRPPKQKEFDVFHSYIDEEIEKSKMSHLSQFFKSSQVLNQLESIIEQNEVQEPNTKILREKNSLDHTQKRKTYTEDIFSNREEIETFFDQIEHSISMMGADTRNKNENVSKFLEVLLNSQAQNTTINNSLQSSQKGQENLQVSISEINASFASALKQILQSNASKNTFPMKMKNNSTLIQPRNKFTEMGPFYGLPLRVKELIKQYKGIEELYDWQDECLRLPAISDRKNLIYALPTSGGKTLVAEILMLRELMCYKKNAIFILPFVAIVQEKVWTLSPFAVALDFLVEEYAASKGTYPPRKRRRKNSIYISTIEKAVGLLNSLVETERLSEIGLIVVDELHLIGEQGRGSTLEALLTKIMFLQADIQVVGMSATIGNISEVATFLNAEVYRQNFRPVELTEYVKCGPEIAKINWNKCEEDLFTMVRRIDQGTDGTNSVDPDRLGKLVMEVIPDSSCLIFCPTKKNCENVAYLLCRVLSKELLEYKREEKHQIKHALKDETGSLCKIFNISIHYGIAYHHSGLTNEERRVIEDGFRAGIISVICCTSTLAAGVNLPAKRVILRQPYVGRDFISLSKYKQMVGRAGRAGLGESGDSILICNNQDLPKVKKLLMSPMDQALSNIHEAQGKGLRHLLLSCIHLGIANTRGELQQVAKKTLLNIQNERLGVNVKKLTDTVISDLFKLGALQEADLTKTENSPDCDISIRMDTSLGNLSTTSINEDSIPTSGSKKRKIVLKNNTKLIISKLGCAAIKGNLELTKAHMLYDDLHQAQKSLVLLDSLHLLYLVTPYDVAEQIKPNKNDYYHIYCKLGPNELQTARILGIDDSVALKLLSHRPIKHVPERVLNRFYLTLMLNDLWNEKPVFEVSEKYQINRGVVQNLMTGAATFASNVVNFCEGLEEFWTFAQLLKGMSQRLSYCCVKELLPLMELPAVKQNRAKQLYNAGYKTLQSIAKADPEALVESIEFLPRRVAKQLVAAAKMLLLEKFENLREEAEDVLDGVDNTDRGV